MPTFTPPTVEQALSTDHFFGRYSISVGVSVVKVDGTYVEMPYPTSEALEAAGPDGDGTDYFLGGRTYTVTDEVAAALDLDGFGYDYIGYGEGAFGGASYGG